MIKCLATVAKEARLKQGRKPIHIAVAADVDPSTIWRFEKGRWPQNADELIAAYADDLDIAPTALWAEALKLWQESLNGRGDRA